MTAMTGERNVLGARFRRWPQALAAVALGLMWLLPSGADAAILKRVHSGITAQPTAGTTVALELPDASKAFVVCSNNSTSGNAQNRQDCILSDNLLTFDAGANITPPFNVSWYVAEFESGVKCQRCTVSFAPGSTTTAPTLTTAVDCSKSFVVLPGESRYNGIVSTGATDEAEIFRAVLGTFASPCGVAPGTTTTTLSIERGSNGSTQCGGCNVYVSWQVVTMDGATVLARATTSLLSGGSTLTVTPSPAMAADPTKAFLLMSPAARSAVAG